VNPTITVFTPTYNRSHCLDRCYHSLQTQTVKDFCWLIIDDGSTDDTISLVKDWIHQSNDFEIRYFYKPNGGLHTGYNFAIEKMDTELCVCVDSDDYMPDDAIEKILKVWSERKSEKYAGIIGLDFYLQGDIVGKPLANENDVNINELLVNGGLVGDKKLVVRTELYKNVAPMPTFEGEKNFNPNYMNVLIGEHFRFLVLNENLCYVEYQEDGMSRNIFEQYLNSPNSFAEIRRLYLNLNSATCSFRFRHAIHYTSSCIIAKNYKQILIGSPRKVLTTFVAPLGVLLALYIRYKTIVKV